MKLSAFKAHLQKEESICFYLPDGQMVPKHFHITEVGRSVKHFSDCSNVLRIEKVATLQVWVSTDFWYRLDQKIILSLINSNNNIFEDEDLEIEIEYQQETIGKYGLEFLDNKFQLTNKQTDCLAKNSCEFPLKKVKLSLKDLQKEF